VKKYYIKPELIEGKTYHNIYVKWFGLFETLLEMWNTHENAIIRINELKNK